MHPLAQSSSSLIFSLVQFLNRRICERMLEVGGIGGLLRVRLVLGVDKFSPRRRALTHFALTIKLATAL